MMNLNNPVFNKILKIKEHLVLGAGAKKKLFEKLKRKIIKGRGNRLSQLEFELLIDALNRAEDYERALDKIEDTLDKVSHYEAITQKIRLEFARNGRTVQTAREVANIVKAPKKGRPWEFIIKDLNMLRDFSKTKQTFTYGGERDKSGKKYKRYKRGEKYIRGKRFKGRPRSQKEIVEILYEHYKQDMSSENAMIKGLRRKGIKDLPTHYRN
jgi:hypothetical protein